MKIHTRFIGLGLLLLFPCALTAQADEAPILERIAELQAKAVAANSGALGCGVGTLRITTSKGEVKVNCGLDPIKVFGNPVKTSDLFTILKSRAESNRSGNEGPMSGRVSDLCYVALYALSCSKDSGGLNPGSC